LQARVVPPTGALIWLAENIQQGAEIRAVDLDGPGDPLAEIECTMETLDLIRREYPDLALSVTTLGLHGEKHAPSLAAAGVTIVTLLVDAVDRKVAEKLYAWIRPGRKTIPLAQATELLMDEQLRAVKAFKAAGCKVTVRSMVYPGFNDDHIEEIARVMAESGAEAMTLVPYRTGADPEEQLLSPPDTATMQRLQEKAAKYLETFLPAVKEMRLGIDCPSLLGACKSISPLQPKPSKTRPNVAVVSSNGIEVDLHLGQAYQVLVYGPREDGLTCLLTTRPVPEPGSGSSRWQELAETLDDCFAILTASAGESPRQILGKQGITVLITDNEIEGTVDVLYGGGKKKKKCS
jgi:nitrogen fixation protein NifB